MSQSPDAIGPRYEVDIRVEQDVLRCVLVNEPMRSDGVIWTLHRGNFDARRASEPVQGGSEWQVRLPDATDGYAVRASVDGVVRESRWVQHFSKSSVRRYDEWRRNWSSARGEILSPISLFRYEEPFDNIAFVCHRGEWVGEAVDGFAARNDLVAERFPGTHWPHLTVLSGRGSAVDEAGTRYVFSGVTRDPERLLFGGGDVQEHVSRVGELRDEIGEFHLLTWDANSITFSHDYIGQGHLFYFQNDDIFAAANGLHLLALTLRAVGVALTFDLPAATGKFFSTTYPFEFHHGLQTDFAGIRRVSVFEGIEINSDGPRTVKTQLWHDDMDVEYSEELYERLLAQAKSDIVDNVRIALEHSRFENVVVELSAGLDSRMIYSALTNLPKSDKIRIATRRSPEERTAVAINNLYGFAWDDLPKEYSFGMEGSSHDIPATSHSVFMDGYYIDAMFRPRTNYTRPTLLLSGHGGEAFSRVMSVAGYPARDFAGKLPESIDRIEDVVANVIRYVGNHQVWFGAGEESFTKTLRDSLDESPSQVFAKKFEDLYVSERNPFVCGSVFRGAMTAPQWRPLHSKALFRLRAMWFQQKQDYRLQFDVIRGLNPLVSEVPYVKPVENARKEEYHSYRAPFSLKAPLALDDSDDLLADARVRSDACSMWVPSRARFNELREAAQEYEMSADSFLDPLGAILQLAPEFDDMGLPLFTYIQRAINRPNPKSFSKRHNVRNKLHILLQEVLLVKGNPTAGGAD